MNIYLYPVAACWLVFMAYWAVSAVGAKKNVGGPVFRRRMYFRAILVLAVLVIAHFTGDWHLARHGGAGEGYDMGAGFFANVLVRSIGVALCALGVALAIWARTVLGRNWGMPMSMKENPELVSSGPYARIRHPIYTGVLVALLGTSFAINAILLIPLVLFSAYFIYSAMTEERSMTRQFPDAYPDYRRRTSMLIPFLL